MHPIHLLVPVAWRSALGLAVLGLTLGVAAPARAQIDLQQVTIAGVILREADAATDSLSAIRILLVLGSGITDATITPPGGDPIRLVESAPGRFESEETFDAEAALTAALPDGDYLLDLNQGEATATLGYARLAVPSPRISFPLHEGVIPPGPLEVQFQRCAICVQDLDSTSATLESGDVTLASESLPATDASWIPGDGLQPLELPPNSTFVVAMVHHAVRTFLLNPSSRDSFVFGNEFVHGDRVAFTTGFAAPTADLCIVVNDPAGLDPEGHCTVHEDGNDAIFDTSGSFATTAAGVPIAYGFTVSPRGRLSGIADLDLDRDGSFETHVPVVGSLSGEDGRLRQNVRIRAASSPPAPDARLKVRVREQTDTANFVTTRLQSANGRLLGARVLETTSTTEAIGDAPRGWRLDFGLSGPQGEISDARLTLSDGRTVPLFGRQRFVFEVNHTNVRLKSGGAERGVQIEIDTLALDDSGTIVRGVMRYRAFGQRGTIRFR